MELSSALVKSLASVTNDSASSSVSTTAYGTAVVSGDKVYVQLDGSSVLTSISVTTDVRTGDRVLVSIENHVATIASNLTTPASGYTASETAEAVQDVVNEVTVLKNGTTTIYCSDADNVPSGADFNLVENDLWYASTTTTDDSDESYTSYTLYRWTGDTWALVEFGSESIAAKSIIAEKISVANLASINANLGAITGGSLNIGNGTFIVDSDGNLTATSATIAGVLTAGSGSMLGYTTDDNGNIVGGWRVTANKIYNLNGGEETESEYSVNDSTGTKTVYPTAVMQQPSVGGYVFAAGGASHSSYEDCPFRVRYDGKLFAKNAVIEDYLYIYDADTSKNLSIYAAGGEICFGNGCHFGNSIEVYGAAYLISSLTVDGGVTSGGSIRLDAQYYSGTGISCQWEDYDSSRTRHYILYRGDDGLTAYFGYAGSSTYSTVSVLRGRTVKYQNSSGTTSLSDERLKTDWQSLGDWDGFFDRLKPYAFKYIDGDSGRYHVGMGAQTVEQALLDAGLTTQDFAGLVKYPAKADEEGDGYHGYDEEYGLIYTEFVGLLVDQVQKLKTRVAALEDKLEGVDSND